MDVPGGSATHLADEARTKVETGMRTRVFVAALVLALGLPGAAFALPSWPNTSLVTENDSGAGSLAGATWAVPTRGDCAVVADDGHYGFPSPPVEWVPGSEIAVRFESAERPRRVYARAFLFGDPTTGTPIYGETKIPNELRRVQVHGEIVWEAVLSPPPWPDLYLEVTAEWKPLARCGPREATWKWRAGLLPV